MTAQVINLADWRDGVRLEGLRLTYRRQQIALTREGARALAEALYSALTRTGGYAAAGFVLHPGRSLLKMHGWDGGVPRLRRSQVVKLAQGLALAATRVVSA